MKKILMTIATTLGFIFLYIGYLYITHPAGTLPSFMPGYLANSYIIHTKHGIAAFLLGIACFVFAWFQSGKKSTT